MKKEKPKLIIKENLRFFLLIKIPCLNDVPIHELSPNSLVRYRCMIQDSFDPIYFSGTQRFRHKGTGEIVNFTLKYKETFEYSVLVLKFKVKNFFKTFH